MMDADAGWVADELQRFFFGSPELLRTLRANLLAAAPELLDDDAAAGYKLRTTELHRAFVALLEGELDARALQRPKPRPFQPQRFASVL